VDSGIGSAWFSRVSVCFLIKRLLKSRNGQHYVCDDAVANVS
jgi:hypothetical protein